MIDTLTQLPTSTAWLLHVSTDIVVFTVRRDHLQVLLRQRYSETFKKSDWALPGGYIRPVEPLEDCALRTLAQQTGIRDVNLEQLYTFGRPDRHPKSRVITVSYFALIPTQQAEGFIQSPNIEWHSVTELPELYLDHAEIISVARQRLVSKLGYSTIAFQGLPELFTLGELQHVYETILGTPLDKRNFRKKVLAQEHIEQTEHFRRKRSHRPARLYRLTKTEKRQALS
ncbi:MAG: NUDIX domain-containing protein [Arenicellales bacterium]|nr:NUDIX domain-containing protein [Arenicellales bacterium]